MALPNPLADKIKMGEPQELSEPKKLTVEEKNGVFQEHLEQLTRSNPFKKGDLVIPNKAMNLIDSVIEPGQVCLVLMAGKQVSDLVNDPFRDLIVEFIDHAGMIQISPIASKFFNKHRKEQ